MPPADLFGSRLTLTSERTDDTVDIVLVGELDIGNAPELEDALLAAEETDALVIRLDLSELEFLDSTGLRVILSSQLRMTMHGDRLRIVPGPERVQRLFALTGTTELLHFEDAAAPPDNVHDLTPPEAG